MWNDLSMKEKAAMMKVAIQNGITNLDSIREEYNKFAMGGPEDFTIDWSKQKASSFVPIENSNSYNPPITGDTYKGKDGYYYKHSFVGTDPEAHFSDIGKTVYHPTFSIDSYYSGKVSQYNPRGTIGGGWTDNSYIPSKSQFINNDFNYNKTKSYLKQNDPNFNINLKNKFLKGGKVSLKGDDDETPVNARHAETLNKLAALRGNQTPVHKDPSGKGSKEVELFQNALNSLALNPGSLSKSYKEASQKQVQKKQERWKEDKENIDMFMNALETATALYGLGKGAAKLLNLEGSSNKYLSWIGKNIDLPQGIMNSVGAVADGYQLLAGTTPWDRVENGVELTGDTAGIIGATNWLRRTPLFSRYGKYIDTTLDVMGYSAAGWDLFKQTPWGEKVENYLGDKVNNYFDK